MNSASELPEPVTYPVLLRRNRDAYGDKRALVTENEAITYAELDDRSRDVAKGMVAAGVGKGARVGLLLPNGVDWPLLASAVWRTGATLVPLSTLLRPTELQAQVRVADVTHLVLAETFRGRSYVDDVEEIAPGIMTATAAGRRHPNLPALRSVWRADVLPTDAVDDELVAALEAAVRPADDFVIVFTSGSRGTPKGTIHTHDSALRAVSSGLAARRVRPDDRVYIPMPLFWTGGLAAGLLTAFVAGATLLTETAPEPERTLAFIERERATLFRGWPDQAARLAAHPKFASADLTSLRPGSLPAVLPPELRPAPGSRANLFGMTETFGPYCGAQLADDLPPDKYGSCGLPLEGVEVRIVDGEIRLRGPNVMRGICGRTREETFDADGFYPTGDLGALDADGYLWFHGRLDDMFKVKGATVYPAEVEAAIRALEGVQQAHVTNVPGDDGSDAVGAFVVSARPLDELVAATRARLSAFKVPTHWVVSPSADRVPMTPTAKVDKAALQQLLQEESRS